MPNPPAISPLGGPQPAGKRNDIADMTRNAVQQMLAAGKRAVTGDPRPPAEPWWAPLNPERASRLVTIPGTDTRFELPDLSGATAAALDSYVPPTVDELNAFLKGVDANQYAGSGLGAGPGGAEGAAFGTALSDATSTDTLEKYIDKPYASRKMLEGADSPEQLARRLGLPLDALDALLQTSRDRFRADTLTAKDGRDVKNQLADQFSPPLPTGGPDAIERQLGGGGDPTDPMSMVTESPMTSEELAQLVVAIQSDAPNRDAAQLEAAKQRILGDAAVAQGRVDEINAAYLAGLQGGPAPSLPGADASATAQGRYATAGPQTASVAATAPIMGQLNTEGTDQAIVQAAYVIEQKRKAVAEETLLTTLADRADKQRAIEDQVVAAQEQADKDAAEKQREAASKTIEVKLRSAYADQKAAPLISDAGMTADQYTKLKKLFASGAPLRDAVKSTFGDPDYPEDFDSSQLTIRQRRVVQMAQFAAGGDVPDEYADDYQERLNAAIAAEVGP